MQNLEAFKELIEIPKDVVITTHQKPDADALGSSLGLAAYLTKKGHRVYVISPTDYPEFLHWMQGHQEVIIYNEGNEKRSERLVKEADIVFCLDFSNLHRIDALGNSIREATAIKVVIDHHLEPEDFADYLLWSTEAAATAELLFGLIVDIGDQALIDKDIAECLYAGIMTDTGSFKHPNTTQNIFRVSAELMGHGADPARVAKLIYDNNSVDRLKFIGFTLSERLKIIPEYKTAYFVISTDDLKRFDSKNGDTEGLVNYALSIKDIKLAAIIIARADEVKLSFRSIGDFSVNELARTHFNGGGHKNASGGKSDLSLQETVAKFESVLKEYRDQLNPTAKTLA